MKVLVLGGNGFIGSHVVDQLLEHKHDVRVFDRTQEKFRSPLRSVDYRIASFDDTPALAEALEGVDVVLHFISTTVPSTSNKDPLYDIESNLKGTVRLLTLMCDANIKRIVYLSSGGTVYGIPERSPIPEGHPLRPICSYGVIKVAIENYIHMFHQLHGLEYVVLRASNPYGPRQGHIGVQGVIGTFLGKVLRGESLEIWGDGSVVRDYINISDLARLCALAAESKEQGIFNAGSGEGLSVKQIISIIEKVSGKKIDIQYKQSRNYDVPEVVLNVDLASSSFCWRPIINIDDGINDSWVWIKEELSSKVVFEVC